jgi:hypothetical protein
MLQERFGLLPKWLEDKLASPDQTHPNEWASGCSKAAPLEAGI